MAFSDIAKLIILAALWGISFLFMRIAAPVLGPVWLIEIRVLLAGLALLPLLLHFKLWQEVRRQAFPLFIVGCVNSALPFLLFAFASLFLPAGFNAILNATTPLFGIAIAAIWFEEKLTLSRAIGLIFGFSGVVILVGWKPVTLTASFSLSVSAGLLAALMYAFSASYIKREFSGVSPLVVATASQFSAAIFLLPALPFTIPQSIPSARIIGSVFALALFSTAFAYLLYLRLIQNVGSTKALTVAYLVPIFAIFWGAIVLQEPVTRSMLLGGSFILLGIGFANDLLPRLLDTRRSQD